MLTLWMRRPITFLMFFSMMSLMRITPLFFARIPFADLWNGYTPTAQRPTMEYPRAKKTITKTVAPLLLDKKAEPVIRRKPMTDLSGLTLHSYSRDYDFVFHGKIDCTGEHCDQAIVHLSFTSYHNVIQEMAPLKADGTYQIHIGVKELPAEQIDWVLSVTKPQSFPTETRGRQILLDEKQLDVERNLSLY